LRFLATGASDAGGATSLVEEGARLLELLGGDVVRVSTVHGPVHAERSAAMAVDGALDGSGLLGAPGYPVVTVPAFDGRAAWAAAGLAALSGDPDGPPWGPPGRLAERVAAVGAVVQLLAACRGTALELDALALLGERAAITGFGRRGRTSVGGSCEIVAASDGWVALNLARPSDVDLLPALVDGEADAGDWPAVSAALARRRCRDLEARAALLGLPLACWPGPDGPDHDRTRAAAPWRIDGQVPRARVRPAGGPPPDPAPERPLVVDLSSLWAGPLASSLLAATGARVIKVEGARRPDGARLGPGAFFDLLNAGKECVALDFDDPRDRDLLDRLVRAADIVIEGSRPRVMAGLGIDPAEVARTAGTTWISITGYGREGACGERVAFGDDAAFAAGFTVDDPPRFLGDAIADPIAGLYAAAVGLAALGGHRGQLVDLSLRGAAAYARGQGGPRAAPYATHDLTWMAASTAAPRARARHAAARPFGADTDAVRAELA
jgi:crotonobetainyl-CoA:carnitine CoA-transferase CaiB-like acyl-CoA transferase